MSTGVNECECVKGCESVCVCVCLTNSSDRLGTQGRGGGGDRRANWCM